jgi:hypothetical protein
LAPYFSSVEARFPRKSFGMWLSARVWYRSRAAREREREAYVPSVLCDDEASLMYNAKVGVSPLLAFARHKGKCRHGIRTTQRPIRSTDRVNSVAYDHCRKRQVLRAPDSPLTARSGRLQRRFVLVTSKHRRRAELPSKHLDRPPDAVKHWP